MSAACTSPAALRRALSLVARGEIERRCAAWQDAIGRETGDDARARRMQAQADLRRWAMILCALLPTAAERAAFEPVRLTGRLTGLLDGQGEERGPESAEEWAQIARTAHATWASHAGRAATPAEQERANALLALKRWLECRAAPHAGPGAHEAEERKKAA